MELKRIREIVNYFNEIANTDIDILRERAKEIAEKKYLRTIYVERGFSVKHFEDIKSFYGSNYYQHPFFVKLHDAYLDECTRIDNMTVLEIAEVYLNGNYDINVYYWFLSKQAKELLSDPRLPKKIAKEEQLYEICLDAKESNSLQEKKEIARIFNEKVDLEQSRKNFVFKISKRLNFNRLNSMTLFEIFRAIIKMPESRAYLDKLLLSDGRYTSEDLKDAFNKYTFTHYGVQGLDLRTIDKGDFLKTLVDSIKLTYEASIYNAKKNIEKVFNDTRTEDDINDLLIRKTQEFLADIENLKRLAAIEVDLGLGEDDMTVYHAINYELPPIVGIDYSDCIDQTDPEELLTLRKDN